MTLPESVADALREVGLNPVYIEDLVRATLEEDLDGGVDVTSDATVSAGQTMVADLVAREGGVVAGLPVAEAAFAVASAGQIQTRRITAEGAQVPSGTVLMTARGSARPMLLAERTALNLVSRMSGVATATRAWADALVGTKARVRDTRKTMPLIRPLDKYAVRAGGGENHRFSLSESALIKDNHVIAAGGVTQAFQAVQRTFPGVPVEVEVDDVLSAIEAVEAGADVVMLDNFTVAEVREAVTAVAGRARLEASGGLSLSDARGYGETGVDYVAVGSLTHSVTALDIGLDFRVTDE
jgi:nicotinate-nucleotide pyrophosphorylase (carboxylating)